MNEAKARELENRIIVLETDLAQTIQKQTELDALLALICSSIKWLGSPEDDERINH